jgi:hypothetical protein
MSKYADTGISRNLARELNPVMSNTFSGDGPAFGPHHTVLMPCLRYRASKSSTLGVAVCTYLDPLSGICEHLLCRVSQESPNPKYWCIIEKELDPY